MSMTDLEICKRIAQIENKYDELLGKQASYNSRLVHVQEEANITRWFNPLTDKKLCFELMVKHKIEVEWLGDECGAYRDDLKGEIHDESPQRAICLAIIEAEGGS